MVLSMKFKILTDLPILRGSTPDGFNSTSEGVGMPFGISSSPVDILW